MILPAPVLRLDGEIRRLLHLQIEAARADGVDDARVYKENVAGLHRNAVDELRHGLRLLLASFDHGRKCLLGDPFAEAEIDAGVRASRQDQP